MLFIQNISKKRVICGDHMSPAKMNCDLIQITCAATFPPKPGMEHFFKRIDLVNYFQLCKFPIYAGTTK